MLILRPLQRICTLLSATLGISACAMDHGIDVETYPLPGTEFLRLEIPKEWKRTVSLSEANAPTIVLSPGKSELPSLQFAILPLKEGHSPTTKEQLEDETENASKLAIKHAKDGKVEVGHLSGQGHGSYISMELTKPMTKGGPSYLVQGLFVLPTAALDFFIFETHKDSAFMKRALNVLAGATVITKP
jgi:hypothetical protein